MKRSDFNKDYRLSHKSKSHAAKYEDLVTGGLIYSALWEWEQRQIVEIVNSLDEGLRNSALDFACGTGRITRVIENKFDETIGLDISESMVEQARLKSSNANFIVGDVTRNPEIVNDEYDFIISFRFFLNAQDELRNSAVSFISKALKREGTFVFNIHLQKSSIQSRLLRAWWFLRREQPLPCLSIAHMEEILEAYSLRVVQERHFGVLPTSSRFFPLPATFYRKIENWLSGKKSMRFLARNVILVCVKN